MDFFEIAAGSRVVELQAGKGYYTELLAERVGTEGAVWAQNNAFVLDRFARGPLGERLTRMGAKHVQALESELDDPQLPSELDAVLIVLFYHDTYWQEVDRAKMNAAVFAALKPGGVYGVVDHYAEDGSGSRDVESLHRVDIELVKKEITEAGFVLQKWDLPKPRIIDALDAGAPVVIVDTNNPAELPDAINDADILAIIDHHKLVGGIETKGPIDITIRPVACTATIMHDLMGDDAAKMPQAIKGAMLSCILSDTLEFRSPTTTDRDREVVEALAADLGIDTAAYAAEMFAAKSDVSAFSDAELLRMDSKAYEVAGTKFRVSVLETTSPGTVLSRKDALVAAMPQVAGEDGVDQVLLFVVDILNEESTLLVPNDLVKTVAEKSFATVVGDADTVVLPGVVSRKKQIIPNLAL